MASGVYLILWIFWFVALLVLYHKVFTVYYFSLSHGLMKELVTSAFLGLIICYNNSCNWAIGYGKNS